MLRWLRRTFLGGLLVVLPLAITFAVLWLIYSWIDSFLGYNTALGKLIRSALGVWIPGLGIYITVLLVLIVGVLTRHYVGRSIYAYFEQRVIYAIPVVRKMYGTIKQIVDAVFARDTSAFQRVVLVEYPRRGLYTVGFVTNDDTGVMTAALPEKCSSVFIFTVPNPMSGYYIIVPDKDLIDLHISVEEGIRLAISMGMAVNGPPTSPQAPEKGVEPKDHVAV